jgi:prepilin-type N-terminal cleavage/methylation domain-containing protein
MNRHSRAGFTLLEMLVVMAALGLLMVLIAGLLTGLVRAERAASEDFQRLLVQSALADRFREDVSRAVDAPERLGEQEAGQACLILRRPDKSHIVYRWTGSELTRQERPLQEAAQVMPVGGEQVSATFLRGEPDNRVVILRLKGLRHEIDFAAALEGGQP